MKKITVLIVVVLFFSFALPYAMEAAGKNGNHLPEGGDGGMAVLQQVIRIGVTASGAGTANARCMSWTAIQRLIAPFLRNGYFVSQNPYKADGHWWIVLKLRK